MVENEQQGEFFRAGTAELLRIFVDARAFFGRGYQKFSKSGDLSLFFRKTRRQMTATRRKIASLRAQKPLLTCFPRREAPETGNYRL